MLTYDSNLTLEKPSFLFLSWFNELCIGNLWKPVDLQTFLPCLTPIGPFVPWDQYFRYYSHYWDTFQHFWRLKSDESHRWVAYFSVRRKPNINKYVLQCLCLPGETYFFGYYSDKCWFKSQFSPRLPPIFSLTCGTFRFLCVVLILLSYFFPGEP